MNDFLQRIVLSNSVESWLIVFGVILFVLILKRLISGYLASLIFGLLNRFWKNLDKVAFKNLVAQPLGLFLLIFVSIISLHKLRFPEDLDFDLYDYSLKRIIHCIGTIILIVSFVWLLLRTIDFSCTILEKKATVTPDHTHKQMIGFFRDFIKVIIVIIGILMVLKFAFHFNIANMLTGLSIVGAAVALALRESLENLIASFIIFFDKPFSIGDLVKVQNITGNVEKIGLRSTRIRTDQKSQVTVPNKQMVDSIVDNLSWRTQLKAELRLQVALSTSPSTIEQLIGGINKILLRDDIENSNIFMSDIAANAFLINADYFTRPMTYAEFIKVKEQVNLQVLRLMENLKIEMAGASTDIRIDGSFSAKRDSLS